MNQTARIGSVVSIIASISSVTTAGGYSFEIIADSAGGYSDFPSPLFGFRVLPAINDLGQVAFGASNPDGQYGLWRGDGNLPIELGLASPNANISIMIDPTLMNSGEAAFFGMHQLDGYGYFRTDAGSVAPIVTQSDQFSNIVRFGSINDLGDVVFMGRRVQSDPFALFTADGQSVAVIAEPDGVIGDFRIRQSSINNLGEIAFVADLVSGETGLFYVTPDSTSMVLSTAENVSSIYEPAINDNGDIVFLGHLDNVGFGVLTLQDGGLSMIAATNGVSSSSMSSPQINGAGDVLFFWQDVDQEGRYFEGIFTGPDMVRDAVIRLGDPLFGSIVTNLFMGEDALNAPGQVAFAYSLSDERVGVAIATIPVSGSVVVVGMGGFLMSRRRR